MIRSFIIILFFYAWLFTDCFETEESESDEKWDRGIYPSIFRAAILGNVQKLERALNRGGDIEEKIHVSSTPLHVAADYGRENATIFLIQKGANISAENGYKDTPLHYAAKSGIKKAVELLIEKGANVNAENRLNRTPLHNAGQWGREKVIEVLLRHGADITAEDKDKKTALHYAAEFGHEKAIEALIQHGANITAEDKDKQTPLRLAAGSARWVRLKVTETLERALMTQGSQRACQGLPRLPVNAIGDSIVGEGAVESGEFPWMVALGYVSYNDGYDDRITFNCAGIILSELFIMTAAHCVKPSHIPVLVRMGTINLIGAEGIKPINRQIKKIIRHPNYNTTNKQHDIALIRLKKKIVFTNIILPACLQTDVGGEHADVGIIVTGWGITSSDRIQRSNVLLKAQAKTMPLTECNSTISRYNADVNQPAYPGGINESQYCAYDLHGRNDSCQRDGGGSLLFFNKGIATIFGINSFNIDCGTTVYTRVAYYFDWFGRIVWFNPF